MTSPTTSDNDSQQSTTAVEQEEAEQGRTITDNSSSSSSPLSSTSTPTAETEETSSSPAAAHISNNLPATTVNRNLSPHTLSADNTTESSFNTQNNHHHHHTTNTQNHLPPSDHVTTTHQLQQQPTTVHVVDPKVAFHPLIPSLIQSQFQFLNPLINPTPPPFTAQPFLISPPQAMIHEKYCSEMTQYWNSQQVQQQSNNNNTSGGEFFSPMMVETEYEQNNAPLLQMNTVHIMQLKELNTMDDMLDDYVKQMQYQLIGNSNSALSASAAVAMDSKDGIMMDQVMKQQGGGGRNASSSSSTAPNNNGSSVVNGMASPSNNNINNRKSGSIGGGGGGHIPSSLDQQQQQQQGMVGDGQASSDLNGSMMGGSNSNGSNVSAAAEMATPIWDRDTLEKMYSDKVNFVVKKKKNFTKEIIAMLDNYFFGHLHDPYPCDQDKQMLMEQTGLSLRQLNTWFGNKRMRYKRKMLKQQQSLNNATGGGHDVDSDDEDDDE